jgi:GNAT superfamily N-acetyltransferase
VFLLSKSFLENKLVGHDVALYTFHVIALDVGTAGTAAREGGARIFAGYFTVEKSAPEHNLACIVVLPCFQGRGLGRLLIAHSYEVSRRRCRIDPTASVGTPERPLSDLGQAMYHRYWDACVWRWAAARAAALERAGRGATEGGATMKEIAAEIELAPEDVRDAVMRLGLLHRTESKALRLLLPRSVAEAAVARGQGRGPHYRSDLYLAA